MALTAASSGCLLRGDTLLEVTDPRLDAWSPGGLLRLALDATGADVNRTTVIRFGATFSEEGILRVLDLRIETHRLDDGQRVYVDFLVGGPYQADRDLVTFRGFTHAERAQEDRPDPAKDWALNASLLAGLEAVTFAQMLAPEAGVAQGGPFVFELKMRPDCKPLPMADGEWHLYNATSAGLEDGGSDWTFTCYARPRLPPAAVAIMHIPCLKSPQCPDARAHAWLVQFGSA
jgi:hypothetical protein